MDLDITNYDYEDILKLFNISKQCQKTGFSQSSR